MCKFHLTFVFYELTIIIVIPESVEGWFIGMNIMITNCCLQVLGSFWSMICHAFDILVGFRGEVVETYRRASWERTGYGNKSASEVVKIDE